jgi:phosphate transport system substrate-binding protein
VHGDRVGVRAGDRLSGHRRENDSASGIKTIKRVVIIEMLAFAFSLRAQTNLPAGNTLLLDQKTVFDLTAGLTQYAEKANISGTITSSGGGIATILINRCAVEFVKIYPQSNLNIEGGGSAHGLEELMAGRADIVPFSRPLQADEVARFKTKFGYEPAEVIVAQDALGIYVNIANPIERLSLEQIELIYSRAPRDGQLAEFWADVGATGSVATQRIFRVSMSKVHGSYAYFRDLILHGENYRFDVNFESVPSSLVQAVGAEPAAIGCAGIMFATARTRFVPLKAADGEYLLPTYQNVVSGRYPFVREMRIVFNRKPDGSMNSVVREFLRFAVSRRGQRVIGLGDNYPLTAEQQQKALRTIGDGLVLPVRKMTAK